MNLKSLENLPLLFLKETKIKTPFQMAGRHKEVIYVGYGVTLKTGLHRFPILCYIAEFLRVFPYFFHHSKDFFFGRNIYHSGSGKINIHLHIAMTA